MSLLMKKGDAAKRKRPLEAANAQAAPAAAGRGPSAAPAPAARGAVAGKPAAPAAAVAEGELWVDKHAPHSSAELAMHKKKVEEIRQWLEQADASLQLGLPPSPRMLVLSGPPGAAKSAALRTVAGELGFELCEWLEGRTLRWVAPTDDWTGGDRLSADNTGYESRLSQFGHFLSSSLRTLSLSVVSAAPPAAARSGCLPSAPPPAPPVRSGLRRRLVLLEELPVSSNAGERASSLMQEQQTLLRRALAAARFPLALILCTDSSTGGVPRQLESILGAAAADAQTVRHVSCNAIADTLLAKAVRAVAAAEAMPLPPELLAHIVRVANGDLRHAINKLQFVLTGTKRGPAGGKAGRAGKKTSAGAGRGDASRGGRAAGRGLSSSGASISGASISGASHYGASDLQERDRFRDLFHTIGKLLHAPSKRAKLMRERQGSHGAAGGRGGGVSGGGPAGAGGWAWGEATGGVGTGGRGAAGGCGWWDEAVPGGEPGSGLASLPPSAPPLAWTTQADGWVVGAEYNSAAAPFGHGAGAPCPAPSRGVAGGARGRVGECEEATAHPPPGTHTALPLPATHPTPNPLPPHSALTAFPPYATLAAVLDGSEPEQLLASSALDEAAALAFLQQNFPTHFSDAADTARAADALSAAACLAGEARARPWLSSALLPLVGSISSRAVTTYNRHPEPSRFSQCSKPASFAAERTARERADAVARAFAPAESVGTGGSVARPGPAPVPGRSGGGAGHGGEQELFSPAGMLGGSQLACELIPYLPTLLPAHACGGFGSAAARGGSWGGRGGGGCYPGSSAAGAGPPRAGLTPSQRECVVALTSLGGRDTGACMAVVPLRAVPAADLFEGPQVLTEEINQW